MAATPLDELILPKGSAEGAEATTRNDGVPAFIHVPTATPSANPSSSGKKMAEESSEDARVDDGYADPLDILAEQRKHSWERTYRSIFREYSLLSDRQKE